MLDLGTLRLAAEQAPPERLITVDMSPDRFNPAPGQQVAATVQMIRDSLDNMIEYLRTRISNASENDVDKIIADPWQNHEAELVLILARELTAPAEQSLKPPTQ